MAGPAPGANIVKKSSPWGPQYCAPDFNIAPLVAGGINSAPAFEICQSVNFGRHLTEILYPFEISYQIFIHTLPYQYLSFRNFTLPKFSFEKSYLTKIFFSEMLRNFTIIKVSVNRLYVNVTLRKLR